MGKSTQMCPASSIEWPDMTVSAEEKNNKAKHCCSCQKKSQTDTETSPLTHLSAEVVSDVACLDMTSIRALVVSENFDLRTGAGTLRNATRQADGKMQHTS